MFSNPAIAYLAEKVDEYFRDEPSGHGWDHAIRVWRNALHIAGFYPGACLKIVEAAALTHDVVDRKITSDPKAASETVRAWLKLAGFTTNETDVVESIIHNISFRGESEKDIAMQIEGKIVQDADRLDAIGAVGIARAFTYGGHHGRNMYDPAVSPERAMDEATYFGSKGSTINHFHEKLLLLKDRMLTPEGRRIAACRHNFMEDFLVQFLSEWHGIFDKHTE